jgi:hypothetical protein
MLERRRRFSPQFRAEAVQMVIDERRGEPLGPPIHAHVIHVHAAFGV